MAVARHHALLEAKATVRVLPRTTLSFATSLRLTPTHPDPFSSSTHRLRLQLAGLQSQATKAYSTSPTCFDSIECVASVDAQGGSLAAYVDLAAMQKAGIAKVIFNEKLDNVAAEVVLGGSRMIGIESVATAY